MARTLLGVLTAEVSQRLNDGGGWNTVPDIGTNVRADDLSVLADDQCRGRCHAIPQQVEDAVGLGHLAIRVGQHRELSRSMLRHAFGVGQVVHAQRDQLGALGPDVGVGLLQLDQLRLADASEEAAVEDDDDRFIGFYEVVEPYRGSARCLQLEVGREER